MFFLSVDPFLIRILTYFGYFVTFVTVDTLFVLQVLLCFVLLALVLFVRDLFRRYYYSFTRLNIIAGHLLHSVSQIRFDLCILLLRVTIHLSDLALLLLHLSICYTNVYYYHHNPLVLSKLPFVATIFKFYHYQVASLLYIYLLTIKTTLCKFIFPVRTVAVNTC